MAGTGRGVGLAKKTPVHRRRSGYPRPTVLDDLARTSSSRRLRMAQRVAGSPPEERLSKHLMPPRRASPPFRTAEKDLASLFSILTLDVATIVALSLAAVVADVRALALVIFLVVLSDPAPPIYAT